MNPNLELIGEMNKRCKAASDCFEAALAAIKRLDTRINALETTVATIVANAASKKQDDLANRHAIAKCLGEHQAQLDKHQLIYQLLGKSIAFHKEELDKHQSILEMINANVIALMNDAMVKALDENVKLEGEQ